MNRAREAGLGLTAFLLTGWLVTAWAGLRPDDRIRAEVRNPGIATKGATVQLFYGMSKQVKEVFCPGAVVPVYRMARDWSGEIYNSKYDVGKIKVTDNLDNRFVKAEVVEGNLRVGDIAMQSSSQCPARTP